MVKIKNKDFFKRPVEEEPQAQQPQAQQAHNAYNAQQAHNAYNAQQPHNAQQAHNANQPHQEEKLERVVQLPQELIDNVKDASETLTKIGLRPLGNEITHLYGKVLDETFTIAFVGEFSRGKSTLINRILGRQVLPHNDLPTTALLTRITYGTQERMIVLDAHGRKLRELPVEEQSWKGLTAANFGDKEPEGSVVIQLPDKFLGKYHISLIDTPGAGDLEAKRARVIEQCLMGADAVVIAINATKTFSMTETQFIRQKLLSKKIPFMAVALTKLDLVGEQEREQIMEFALKKLEQLKIKIPVLVFDDSVKIPGGKYDNVIGVDKFYSLALAWLTNEHRRELTEQWLVTNVRATLNVASGVLAQQKAIVDAKGEEKEKIIAQRNLALSKVKEKWEALRDEMKQRCQKCIDKFNSKATGYGSNIAEALQHEVGRVPNAKEWLEKEYAYRVKRELSAMSLSLDKLVETTVAADLNWLNNTLAQQFKEVVRVTPEEFNAKDNFQPDVTPESLKLESIKDKSLRATVAGSAITLGAALLLGATGAAPLIIATMGVGTGINVFSRKNIEKKGQLQKEQVQDLIARDIPNIIQEATADSAVKIKILYSDIISESLATETRWMQTQRSLIRQSVKGEGDDKAAEKLAKQTEEVERLKKLFE